MAIIWKKILGVEECGRDDNFFHLGGDSLKAMQVAIALKKDLNIDGVNSSQLFSNPLLKDFALVVRSLERREIYPLKSTGLTKGSLSQHQESLWLINHLHGLSNTYKLHFAFTIDGDFDLTAFFSSFKNLLHRHEILNPRRRTSAYSNNIKYSRGHNSL